MKRLFIILSAAALTAGAGCSNNESEAPADGYGRLSIDCSASDDITAGIQAAAPVDSYVTPDGGHIFSESPMNFENSAGEMPVYWEQLFGRLGIEVPQGVMGTNPKQMSEEPVLEAVELDFPQD